MKSLLAILLFVMTQSAVAHDHIPTYTCITKEMTVYTAKEDKIVVVVSLHTNTALFFIIEDSDGNMHRIVIGDKKADKCVEQKGKQST